ncbi:hypothetical protein HT102_10500 [Hoyosella sp. G463]|uniref:Lipoprotein LppV n=1 Tax=Lolliginicoccus lacisalsi TaxID=2742202 RepID=A0A927JCR1_9ACTN|nr:LppA family lipoprotein [Lolliginicoccus lacisalsi]MBD8506918.1 hypothetical protein [Lolliginicoccus lacisalsi]
MPIISAALAVSGCGEAMNNPYNHSEQEVAHAAATLRGLPALEETEAQIVAVVAKIKAAASRINAGLQWEEARPRRAGGCGGAFANTDGSSVTMAVWVSDTPIPDNDWPAILRAARDIAAGSGITGIAVRADKPGHHDVVLTGEAGTRIALGTKLAASISSETGCRYTAQDMPTGIAKG